MNYSPFYFNPGYSYAIPRASTGLFGRLFGGLNLSSILNGASKTINVVNQTIPLIKQARPIMNNAKTMFRIMNEFKKVDTPKTTNNTVKEEVVKTENANDNMPVFFI